MLTVICLLLLVQSIGYGITQRLFPFSSEKVVFLSPVFGLAYMSASGWIAYRLGIQLDRAGVLLTLTPMFALSIYTLWQHLRANQRLALRFSRRFLAFAACFFPTAGILLIPLLMRPDAIIFTLGNNDVAHQSTISRFLMEQGQDGLSGYVAQYPHAFKWFAENTYFAYYACVAQIAAVLGKLPHQVVSGVICCIGSLASGLLFLICRRIFGISRLTATIWSVLGAANALSLYVSYHGFGGQVFGNFFSLAMMLMLLFPRTGMWSVKEAFAQAVLIGMPVVGLMLSYSHMLPFVVAVSFLWRAIESVHDRNPGGPKQWVIKALLGALFCTVILPDRILSYFTWINEAATSNSGWPMAIPGPDHLLGLIGTTMDQAHMVSQSSLTLLRLGVLTILAALLAFGFRIVRRKAKTRLVALVVVFVTLYVTALAFALAEDGPKLESYRSFKLLAFFAPLLSVMIATCWSGLWRRGSGGRTAAAFILIGYGALWGTGVLAMARGDGRGNVLDRGSEALIPLAESTDFKSLNVLSEDHWASMWITYFFVNKAVYHSHQTYYPPAPLVGEISLIGKWTPFAELLPDPNTPVVWGHQLNNGPNQFLVTLGKGWHGPEQSHVWMGSDSRDAEIVILSVKPLETLKARVQLLPFVPNNTYSAFWNESAIAEDVGDPNLSLLLTNVTVGRNVLRLRSGLQPQAPGGGDTRPIAFGLQHIEFRVAD